MIELPALFPTRCAICGMEGNATELYPASLRQGALNPLIFSARRLPDRLHYRMVKCNLCGLIRSDPVASPADLATLYQGSSFTYGDEIFNLRQTYGKYLKKVSRYLGQKDSLLEIGCGNGFFLEEARQQGYRIVRGVEPSREAVSGANPSVQPGIICEMMRPGLFQAMAFDVVCMFQVLDHLAEPGVLLDECYRILKPGGILLCLNHNINSWSARLLKERSPIIDIEHTYLFSPLTMARLLERRGFRVRRSGTVYNRYTLYYLLHLLPLPERMKPKILGFLKSNPAGRIPITVPLGNLFTLAQKPEQNQGMP